MWKKILALLSVGVILASCTHQSKNQFVISGHIEGGQGKTLYLRNANNGDFSPVDSVTIDKDGNFKITGQGYYYPMFYALTLDQDFINVAADSATNLQIEAQSNNFSGTYKLIKSDCANIQMKQITALTKKADRQIDSLNLKLRRNDISFSDFSQKVLDVVNQLKMIFFKDYILKKPASAAAYFALYQQNNGLMYFNIFDPQDLNAFNTVATAYDFYFPNAPYTKTLKDLTLQGIAAKKKAREDAQKRVEMVRGSKMESLPQLKLIDNHGKEQDLNKIVSEKAKVLLVFNSFASEDSPQLINTLRKVSKEKSIAIYCVGVDQDRYFWQNAVRTLPWINVCDPLQEGLSKFNVRSLPSFFLLTPETIQRINNPLAI
ncbi:DUF4369 domain-containing protein [Falsiporphyromonas endometrii]|uniref:DUF4369 domain-containing protein n=1 Tax=Falsiporphyromonas endometrii TaxID=1387297 RepID=A0ABV9K831_9PORP